MLKMYAKTAILAKMLEIFLILNFKISILRVGKMLAGCLIFGNFDPRMLIKLMLIKKSVSDFFSKRVSAARRYDE